MFQMEEIQVIPEAWQGDSIICVMYITSVGFALLDDLIDVGEPLCRGSPDLDGDRGSCLSLDMNPAAFEHWKDHS